ncbi:MAG: Asp23/Gls24 family envelope stress response protein [Clostridia bacterium]|nr:Asp23/Gls24 family envelope stress response protein [Clostridia bacterium]
MSEDEKEPIEIIGEVVEEKVVDEKKFEESEVNNESLEKNEQIENEVSDDESETHGINISEEVVATIAGIAASEVKGVASMSGGFVGGLSEMLGKKTKGVKVQVGEKDTVIDINLTVEYGARIPDIAWEVQNKVKTQVESMTGLNVVAVNIHVQGVSLPKKNKPESAANSDDEKLEEKQN